MKKLVWEMADKVIKNRFASEIVYESIKDMKTIGILGEKDSVMDVAVPVENMQENLFHQLIQHLQ